MDTAGQDGALFFAPEPKSPHGSDVTPGGEFVVVGGKLDPHVTIYSTEKIKQAQQKLDSFKKDAYGVPVVPLDQVMETQVELGLGPLHTVFDDKGYAYTSLFLDSAVARWTLVARIRTSITEVENSSNRKGAAPTRPVRAIDGYLLDPICTT